MFNIFCGASASSPFKTKHDIASYEIDLIGLSATTMTTEEYQVVQCKWNLILVKG